MSDDNEGFFLNLDDIGESLIENIDEEGLEDICFGEQLPEDLADLDEKTIDLLLKAVRIQYAKLEEEKSHLLQLTNAIKEKMNLNLANDVGRQKTIDPLAHPLDLDINGVNDEEEEEEEEEDEEDEED